VSIRFAPSRLFLVKKFWSTSPTELLSDLYRGLDRVSSCAIPPSAGYHCTEEKTEGAMFISLFSVRRSLSRRPAEAEQDIGDLPPGAWESASLLPIATLAKNPWSLARSY
jgi:hypothetical protein